LSRGSEVMSVQSCPYVPAAPLCLHVVSTEIQPARQGLCDHFSEVTARVWRQANSYQHDRCRGSSLDTADFHPEGVAPSRHVSGVARNLIFPGRQKSQRFISAEKLHCSAASRTLSTSTRTFFNLPIRVRMRLTKRGACRADLCALFCNMLLMRRRPRHEVGMQETHLRAVQQCDQMGRLIMRVTTMQDMGHRCRAQAVTLEAVLYAVLHCFGSRLLFHVRPFKV
jgi:hypothetical protein